MIDRCEMVLYLELIVEVLESNIVKLASIIGDEHKQNPKPDNNVLLDEFLCLASVIVANGSASTRLVK